MRFHICLSNHNPIGRRTLFDMVSWVEAGLLELGHEVTHSNTEVHSDAINIFWENFLPGMGKKIKETGATYGIVATEIPARGTFNGRTDGEWPWRWEGFSEAADGASFIWTMLEDTVSYYSQFAPTAYLELGFSKLLVPEPRNESLKFEFSFFGQKTPYREQLVKTIKKYATVSWPETIVDPTDVDTLIANSKVGLCLKQSSTWSTPSPARLARLLMSKRGIAMERTPVMIRQAKYIPLPSEEEDFVYFALNRLKTWKEESEVAFSRFKNEMPMSEIMECALECTKVISLRPKGVLYCKELMINPPEQIESYLEFNILSYCGLYYAVPKLLGRFDPIRNQADNRLMKDNSLENLRERIRDSSNPFAVMIVKIIKRIKKSITQLKKYIPRRV